MIDTRSPGFARFARRLFVGSLAVLAATLVLVAVAGRAAAPGSSSPPSLPASSAVPAEPTTSAPAVDAATDGGSSRLPDVHVPNPDLPGHNPVRVHVLPVPHVHVRRHLF